jgi:hypothetical protein
MRYGSATRFALGFVAFLLGACDGSVKRNPGNERPDAGAEAGSAGTRGDASVAGAGGSDAGVTTSTGGAGGAGGGGNVFPESKIPAELGPVSSRPPSDEPGAVRVDDCDLPADGVVALASAGSGGPLGVDRDYVYFVGGRSKNCRFAGSNVLVCDHESFVQRAPRCGGPIEVLGEPFSTPIQHLVAGAGNLYVATGQYDGSSQLLRITPEGKRELVVAKQCVADVVADEAGFVVADSCNNRVARGTHDSTELHTITTGFSIDHLALGTSNVYFATSEGIRWATRDGSRTGLFTEGPASSSIRGLGVDGSVLFVEWGADVPERKSFTLARVPFDGSAVDRYGPFFENVSGIPSIDVADGFVRFNALEDADRSIQRVATKSGSRPISVAKREYSYVRGYGERTYWAENGSLLTALEAPQRHCYDEHEPESQRTFSADGSFQFDNAAFDTAGNLFVSGSGPENVDLGLGPVALDSQEEVLAKFDPTGKLAWAMAVPGYAALSVAGQGGLVVSTDQSISRVSTSGSTEWKVEAPVRVRSSVAAEDGSAYALEVNLDASVRVRALSPKGDEIWSRAVDVPAGLEPFAPLSIAVSTDAVVAGISFTQRAAVGQPADPAADATLLVNLGIADGTEKWSRLIRGGRGSVAARPGELVVVGESMFAVDAGSRSVPVPQARDTYVFVARYAEDGSPKSLRYLDLPGGGVPVLTSDGGFYLSSYGCSSKLVPGPDSPGDRLASVTVVGVSPSDQVTWTGIGSYGNGVSVAVGTDSVVVATGVDGADGGGAQGALLTFPR